MSAFGVGLALLSAVAHAAWNTLGKRVAGEGVGFIWFSNVLSVAFLVPVLVVWFAVSSAPFDWGWALAGVASGVLHGVYSLVLQRGYAATASMIVYPVSRGTAPILVGLFAFVALGQVPSGVSIAGVLVVLAGIAMLTLGAARSGDGDAAGMAWGAAVGLCIAGYSTFDAYAVVVLGVDVVGFYAVIAVFTLVTLTIATGRRMRDGWAAGRRRLGAASLIAVLIPVSYVAALFANALVDATVVTAIRSASIVFGAVFAWMLLGERLSPFQVVACVVASSGIALMAF